MPALQHARQEIIKSLKAALGKGYSPSADELEIPKVSDLGDVAFPCFGLAKGLKRNPAELAAEIAPKILASGLVEKAEANGPYINFFLHINRLAELVLQEVEAENYGSSDAGAGKKIMVEFYQEIHVGHLRTALIGQAVVNVERANGTTVVPVSYINDLGIHVAKCLWAIQKFYPNVEPSKEDRNSFLGRVYTEASVWLEEHPEDKDEVHKIFQSLEQGHRGWIGLWKKTKKWSMDIIEGVAKELGLTIEHWYFESLLVDRAGRIVDDLLKQGMAKISEGATIVDLENQDLGVNLLRRTDGTLLYNAKDLALAFKKEEQHSPDLSLYVIDVRQSLAMRQLFATLKLMGLHKQLEQHNSSQELQYH